MRLLRGSRSASTADALPPARLIWGDEALQLTGWPAGFDFEHALQRTDAFGSFILRFIQVCAVQAHQRDLLAIAEAIAWNPGSASPSAPVLTTVGGSTSDGLVGPAISAGPHHIGHAPRGLQQRLPSGPYAATLGMFGDIVGAKVFMPDERSALL